MTAADRLAALPPDQRAQLVAAFASEPVVPVDPPCLADGEDS